MLLAIFEGASGTLQGAAAISIWGFGRRELGLPCTQRYPEGNQGLSARKC